jgi:hypothetical protein
LWSHGAIGSLPQKSADEKKFRIDGAVLAWFGTVIDPLSSDLVLLSTATQTVSPLIFANNCPHMPHDETTFAPWA